jgi:hypothetical protein
MDKVNSICCSLFACLLYCSCSETQAVDQSIKVDTTALNLLYIQEARQLIHTGDLVLRTGNDYASEQVRDMSATDKTYSHGGIAVVENDKVYVYHIEPDFNHINDKVRKEPLDSFYNLKNNLGFAIGRYNLSENEINEFINYLDRQYKKQIPFDMTFSLNTDDSLYCSEMIKKGLASSTGNRVEIETGRIVDKNKYKIIRKYFKLDDEQIAKARIIPIDHLFLIPSCTILKRYVYLR